MRFIVHSHIPPAAVLANLGEVEYSYGLVLREFEPVLRRLGEVTFIDDPAKADNAGADTLFLSFSPPHLTRVAQETPTVPVFAWEFDTIPTDTWYDDPANDWRTTLSRCRGAIVHSALTVTAIKAAMGPNFPAAALPAPVFDRMQGVAAKGGPSPQRLSIRKGVVMDTRDPAIAEVWPSQALVAEVLNDRDIEARTGASSNGGSLSGAMATIRRHISAWRRTVFGDFGPAPRTLPNSQLRFADAAPKSGLWRLRRRTVDLDGLVFTTVFNPYDGRKNWEDLLTAFCVTMAERPDATLVFKLSHTAFRQPMCDMLMYLARMPAFKCRVVLIHGALAQADYDALVEASHFVVNASHGEGQCLPLMEFMSAGRPAIAPDHSGMADYISPDVALVVRSWLDATTWPHDPRIAYRTLRHQLDWSSLAEAFGRAYSFARDDEKGYAAMGSRARERMREHCSQAAVGRRLEDFLRALTEA